MRDFTLLFSQALLFAQKIKAFSISVDKLSAAVPHLAKPQESCFLPICFMPVQSYPSLEAKHIGNKYEEKSLQHKLLYEEDLYSFLWLPQTWKKLRCSISALPQSSLVVRLLPMSVRTLKLYVWMRGADPIPL